MGNKRREKKRRDREAVACCCKKGRCGGEMVQQTPVKQQGRWGNSSLGVHLYPCFHKVPPLVPPQICQSLYNQRSVCSLLLATVLLLSGTRSGLGKIIFINAVGLACSHGMESNTVNCIENRYWSISNTINITCPVDIVLVMCYVYVSFIPPHISTCTEFKFIVQNKMKK